MYTLTVPSAAPTSVSVSDVTSSTITVQWGAVECVHQNGHIRGYTVEYGVQGSENTETMHFSRSETKAIISGLTSLTSYTIKLAAVNSVGVGEYTSISTETDST